MPVKGTRHVPIKGTLIEDTDRAAAAGPLEVFRIDEECERLSRIDEVGKFKPKHPQNFVGDVRAADLAGQAGLGGVEVLAVYFAANARTKPHIHPTQQLLYFVRGSGFVAFPGKTDRSSLRAA